MSTKLRALIIEDSEQDTVLLARELERGSYDLTYKRVASAKDVTNALASETWDIIFGDYTMPGFRGTEALNLLKKSGLDIPFIFVSGTIGEDTAVEAMRNGAHDYILKGNFKRLVPAVERELREALVRRERKRAKEALRIAERRFEELVEFAPDGILGVNVEGCISLANAQMEELCGYSRGELIGQPVEILLPEHLRGAHVGHRAGYVSRPSRRPMGARLDLYCRRKDGSTVPVDISLSPLRTDGELLIISIIRDITDRKRAEEEIQHNLERIRALHEIDLAITSTLDLKTVLDVLLEKIDLILPYSAATIRLWNEETGLLEPVACRNINEKEWKADEWKGGRGFPNAVFRTKTTVSIGNCQTDPRVRDHEFFRKRSLVSYLGVPLIAHDQILGVISFYTKAEHEFTGDEIGFLETLAGQAAIAITNAQLYEGMAKANKVKDEFLSVMSHELRTPLNVVVGYTGMIMDGMLGEVNQKQKEALEKIIRRANDQLVIVNNILFATVLESEKIKTESQTVNLSDFLNQLRSTYDAPVNKELALRWDYPSDLPIINTDSAKLKHVLHNLIDNALKFTSQGHVTISVQPPQASTKWLEIKVADSGVGIPQEQLPFIFDKFRQVDSSETRSFGGVGMGLYIVKKFTELLGGTVEVKSEPGKGSTFTVTIPVEQ